MISHPKIAMTVLAAVAGLSSLAVGAGAGEARAAEAALQVVTTVEDLAAITREVGGDRVEVQHLVRGSLDPHFVSATPSLMTRVNGADVFIEIGMGLEIWAENVLDGARNPRVRRGAPGHIYAAAGCPVLDRPARVTRAEGEIHAEGNPHVNLDPLNHKIIAANVAAGLTRLRPGDATYFSERLADFEKRIDEAYFGEELVRLLGGKTLVKLRRQGKLIGFLEKKSYKGKPLIDRLDGWLGRMLPYRGTAVVTFHRTWSHLASAFELVVVGELEPKPGLPPSAGHVAEVEAVIASRAVPVILYEAYFDEDVVEGVCGRTAAKPLLLPGFVGGVDEATDVFSMFDAICDRFDAAMGKKGGE